MSEPGPSSSNALGPGEASTTKTSALPTVASIATAPWKGSITVLSDLLVPQIQLVDEQVKLTRNSQISLADEIESLNETLLAVMQTVKDQTELDAYLEKLSMAQKKLHGITSSVDASHERLVKLGKLIEKESAKQRINNASRGNIAPAIS